MKNAENAGKRQAWFDIDAQKIVRERNGAAGGGVPLNWAWKDGRIYLDSGDSHTLVLGAAGSQKSRAVVMPTMRLLGLAGESMIVHDCKGELRSALAWELSRAGYRIVTLNFREPAQGNGWNPLAVPYGHYCAGDLERACDGIGQVVDSLMGETADPRGGELLFGLILLLMRYCKDYNRPDGSVSLSNLLALRKNLFDDRLQMANAALWGYASQDELIASGISGVVNATDGERETVLRILDRRLRPFVIRRELTDMLSEQDFDLEDVTETKTAVFLMTAGEDAAAQSLTSLFIRQSCEVFLDQAAQRKDRRVRLRTNYILDDFGLLPPVADMPALLAAAGPGGLRFLLTARSKAGLEDRYGRAGEEIFLGCANWIFLGSRELPLLRELEALCGGETGISVYGLQHLSREKREALVMADRQEPEITELPDLNAFGHWDRGNYPMKPRETKKCPRLDFSLENHPARRTPARPEEVIPLEWAPEENPGAEQAQRDLDMIRQINAQLAAMESMSLSRQRGEDTDNGGK